MILNLQTNCINKVYISGYADKIRRFTENDKKVLEFTLIVLNEGFDKKVQKKKVFQTHFNARAEGNKAEAGKWLKTTSFVLIEGILSRRGKIDQIQIQHLSNAQPIIRQVEYDIVEEEING